MSCKVELVESSDVAIRLDGVNKFYNIYDKPYHRLLQGIFRGKRTFHDVFWALKDISFEVRKGETLGIIGANGAGKSTLLQIVSGTLRPSSGRVEVFGRVAALLELGAGFNPEFSGRENVFVYGSVLGIPKEEIEARYDEIAAFADIGEFIDQPVKKYSSGMYVRLAFAISACVDPDILIIDEALAVGDTRFQIKCVQRLRKLREQGKTILFVSHSMEMVKRFCENAVWLKHGEICQQGPASYVCDSYYAESIEGTESYAEDSPEPGRATGSSFLARIIDVKAGRPKYSVFDNLKVTVSYEIMEEKIDNFLVGVAIRRAGDDLYLFGPNTSLDDFEVPATRGRHVINYEIERLTLNGGNYYIDVGIFYDRSIVCLDYKSRVLEFEIESEYRFEGLTYLDHRWFCS